MFFSSLIFFNRKTSNKKRDSIESKNYLFTIRYHINFQIMCEIIQCNVYLIKNI